MKTVFFATFKHALEYTTEDGNIAYLTSTKQYDTLSELFTALSKQEALLINNVSDIQIRKATIKI